MRTETVVGELIHYLTARYRVDSEEAAFIEARPHYLTCDSSMIGAWHPCSCGAPREALADRTSRASALLTLTALWAELDREDVVTVGLFAEILTAMAEPYRNRRDFPHETLDGQLTRVLE